MGGKKQGPGAKDQRTGNRKAGNGGAGSGGAARKKPELSPLVPSPESLFPIPYPLFYRQRHMATSEIVVPHPAAEAEEIYRRWIRFLDEEFLRHCSEERRSEIVRDQLLQIYLGRPHSGKLNLSLTSELPGNVVSLSLDPMNVTLEAEHFPEVDRERFALRKPLLWFWQMFDRSPLGLNHWLGLRFRCMLGRHIFEHLGSGSGGGSTGDKKKCCCCCATDLNIPQGEVSQYKPTSNAVGNFFRAWVTLQYKEWDKPCDDCQLEDRK